ncbi:MAG: SDR family oxidoreductase [Chloroflexota bacterium]|nr:SDR family oxidoreductase [Chloroflexota bacterium]
MNKQILIVGATGRTGRLIVRKRLEVGRRPHILARDPVKARDLFGEDVATFVGDVRQPETLTEAVAGCDTLISAIGSLSPVGPDCPRYVDFEGVANLVDTAREAGVRRFVLISSIAVTHPEHPLNNFGRVLDWKRAGEECLVDSGLNYTIIRPGGLKNTAGDLRRLLIDQGDRLVGFLSRSDLAEACLQALCHPSSHRAIFELIENEHKGPPDWRALFSSLI